jgi:tRNA-splicing ligase RtcB (3'-phosphate/5'-hydroxy nucleic acid ligase)
VHYGKGATVGSVIAMRGAVCPAAVGVDIGCGMSAVRTSLTADDLPGDLSRLRSRIEQMIPVGRGMHDSPVDPARLHGFTTGGWDDFWGRFDGVAEAVRFRQERATKQMGTLGSGNHFVEVCTDTTGAVWLMLHSGSRNIGKELAEHHIEAAMRLPHNQDLPDRDLAVFVNGTRKMEEYRRDLFWAQDYARRNRAVMMALTQNVVSRFFAGKRVRWEDVISCHHNYVAEETYDDVELLVTRKGAIRAGEGDLGIIPGSMATGTYIVRGLGNESAFNSASHGAGRRMSRTKAKKSFTVDDLIEQTRGVECRKDPGVIDEIPGAYKDIESVIEAQADLVEVVAHLRQLICVKG